MECRGINDGTKRAQLRALERLHLGGVAGGSACITWRLQPIMGASTREIAPALATVSEVREKSREKPGTCCANSPYAK